MKGNKFMFNQDIHQYLTENLKQGFPRDNLVQALLGAGWAAGDIEATLFVIDNNPSSVPVLPPEVKTPAEAGIAFQAEEQITPATIRAHRSWLPIAIIAGIFFVLSVSAGLAYFIISGGGGPTDEEILSKMQDTMRGLHSYQMNMGMDMTGELKPMGDGKSPFGGTISVGTMHLVMNATTSTILGETASTTKVDTLFDFMGNLGYGGFSMTFDGAMNVRKPDEVIYVKVTKVPEFIAMIIPRGVYQSWIDKWISIDKKDIVSMFEDQGEAFSMAFSSSTASAFQNREKQAEILRNNWPFVVTRMEDNIPLRMNGEKLYHFAVTVNEAKLHTFLWDSLRASPEEYSFPEESVDEYAKEMAKIFASTTGQFLIGADTFYLYKMTLHTPLDFATSSAALKGALDIEVRMSQHNAVAPIVLPIDATPLSKVIQSVEESTKNLETSMEYGGEGSALLVARARARDAQRISDIKSIQLGLEMYFDAHNRQYPKSLGLLVPEYLPKTFTDPTDLVSYTYVVLNNGKGYAVGASLEREDNSMLKRDEDQNISAFKTSDIAGCHGEKDRYCFDLSSSTY